MKFLQLIDCCAARSYISSDGFDESFNSSLQLKSIMTKWYFRLVLMIKARVQAQTQIATSVGNRLEFLHFLWQKPEVGSRKESRTSAVLLDPFDRFDYILIVVLLRCSWHARRSAWL